MIEGGSPPRSGWGRRCQWGGLRPRSVNPPILLAGELLVGNPDEPLVPGGPVLGVRLGDLGREEYIASMSLTGWVCVPGYKPNR